MRSRYTAYSMQAIDYIEQTMQGVAAKGFNKSSALAWSEQVKWLGLTIVSTRTKNVIGFVEFIAYYQADGKDCALHEVSKFKKIAGIWYYVDGKIRG